jgi:hypothetical protein
MLAFSRQRKNSSSSAKTALKAYTVCRLFVSLHVQEVTSTLETRETPPVDTVIFLNSSSPTLIILNVYVPINIFTALNPNDANLVTIHAFRVGVDLHAIYAIH